MLQQSSFSALYNKPADISTLFISDIHLCERKQTITAGFLHFLRTRAIRANALYILGDLFDTWIGVDDSNSLNHIISTELKILGKHGIPCYFIHGNRDFLIDECYAATYGMTALPTQRILHIGGHRIIILHGDTLCTDDTNYQSFRRKVHQPWIQKLFLNLPLRIRQHIAEKIRMQSIEAHAIKSAEILDVNLQTVMEIMRYTNAKVMIHGHTHQPATHYLSSERCRVVLGAWHHHQGSVVEVNADGITLIEFPFFS